jgi:uridine kinase
MVYIIGITGGSGSGKTSTCSVIMEQLNTSGVNDIIVISMDSFYLSLPDDCDPNTINFDHPSSFDWELIFSVFRKLKKGKSVDIPIYNFETHRRQGFTKVNPSRCVIFEGILSLYDEKIRNLLDIKIYVDTPSDIRLIRRIRRDIEDRGRDLKSVLDQCEKTVIPSHDQFIEPTKKYADLIIPRGKSNTIAISVMVNQIHKQT